MKNILSTFLFLPLVISLFAQTPPNWTIQSSGTNVRLNDVSFTDEFNGWAVGESGTVLKTTDGGDNWTSLPFPDSNSIYSVAFASPDTGYVVTRDFAPYFTHDGGSSWAKDSDLGVNCFMEKVRIAPDGQVYFIYFGCFEAGRILSWNPVTGDTMDVSTNLELGFSFADSLQDIDFPQAGTAVAVGDEGMILRTTNNGDTWNVIAPPDTNIQFVAVDFIDADTGFAVTTDNFNPQWKTTDGGLTWFIDPDWDPTFFYPVWEDIEYLSSGFGLLAGSGGGMGLVFQRNYFGGSASFSDSLFALDAVRDSLAWVVGNNGFIARLGSPLLSVDQGQAQLPFEVYPNPAHNQVTLRWEALLKQGGTLRLLNLQGQQLQAWEILTATPPADLHFNLERVARGLYFLELEAGDRTGTHKLVVH